MFTKKAVDAIFSTGLLAALWEMEDRPWATYDKGKTMTPFQLVGLLAPFGIEPDRVRIGGEQRRGYALAWFAETFNRYGIVVTPVTAV